jgi:glyceraldehyde-3-phosphate dehydrogenase (NADP+)
MKHQDGVGDGSPMLVAGEWLTRPERLEVRNPLTGERVGTVPRGTPGDIRRSLDAAEAAQRQPFPAHARYDVLMRAADRVEARQEEYAWTIAREGSKAIREARREPVRVARLLRLAAEEGRRVAGETLPFEIRPGSENREGYYFRVPVGIVGAITPFNDPLAMAAHKVAPALAAGNSVVLKPGTATPFSALGLARELLAAGLPPGRLSVVTGRGEALGEALVTDPRVRLVSFTGGVETGTKITRLAGIKKLSMELGSNSPVIVNADARLDEAVAAIAEGAFAQAGQNCLGVQRVLILDPVYDAFVERFSAHVATLQAGASTEETTDVCALISLAQAERIEAWIREAVERGARVVVGGKREGALVWPTVLTGVPDGVRLDCEEAYGPVVSLYRVATLAEAIGRANRVSYGLHSAIFTESLRDAYQAIKQLDFGAVIVNDSTDYRLDTMPFGGTRLSGIGREGVRFAVQEMTETRVVCFNL